MELSLSLSLSSCSVNHDEIVKGKRKTVGERGEGTPIGTDILFVSDSRTHSSRIVVVVVVVGNIYSGS